MDSQLVPPLDTLRKCSPEQRAAWIASLLRDSQLRQDFERLRMSPDAPVPRTVEPLVSESTAHPSPPDTPSASGSGTACANDSISGYQLDELIGTGGMGAVYRGQQLEPVGRTVAIKVIKEGQESGQFLRRFSTEQQTLAMMNHPGIAVLYDAGVTRQNKPFFAMELIDGPNLIRYCNQKGMPVRERLKLFARLLEAVGYAHQKGIIHRDLKPSNVLVAESRRNAADSSADATAPPSTDRQALAQPKIIDFGLAKARELALPEGNQTAAQDILGSFPYMSPEQAGHVAPEEIDTRTDIYSLGATLYELLTGDTPVPKQRFHQAPLAERLRLVLHEEIVPPSRCLTDRGRDSDHASRCETTPDKLVRSVRGDLDTIVLKALDKDRENRFATVDEFLGEIERHLAGEPLGIRSDSTAYRLGKLARKHWGKLLIAAAFVLVLVTATAVSVRQAVVARRLQHEAEQSENRLANAKSSLQALLISLSETFAPEAKQSTSVERLRSDAPAVLAALAADLEEKARTARMFSNMFLQAKQSSEARDYAQIAYDTFRDLHGENHEDTLLAKAALGNAFVEGGDYAKGEEMLTASLAGLREQLPPNEREALAVEHNLANAMLQQRNYDTALPLLRKNFEARKRAFGIGDLDTINTANSLATVLTHLGEREEARKILLEALEPIRGDSTNRRAILLLNTLGGLDLELKNYPSARTVLEEARRRARVVLGEEHLTTAAILSNLATAYYHEAELEKAEQAIRTCLGVRERLDAATDLVVESRLQLAQILSQQGRTEEALPLFEEAYRYARERDPGHPTALVGGLNLGLAYAKAGRLDDAERQFRKIIATIEADPHANQALLPFAQRQLAAVQRMKESKPETPVP